jgi:hypothetical protein
MKVTVSTDANDPEYVGRVLYDFLELAKQEPYLAMKMVEFLQSGITQAFRDYQFQMNRNLGDLQGQVFREETLNMKAVRDAFDKDIPRWQTLA